MILLPPRSTRTAPLFPYTTLFRSVVPGKLMFITDIDLRLGIAGPDAAINARGSGTVRQHVIAAAPQVSHDNLVQFQIGPYFHALFRSRMGREPEKKE